MALESLDTTLRDGSQCEGISFTIADKLAIISALDDFGVDIIECGNPYSNPKDNQLFELLKGKKTKKARLAAFGVTKKKGTKASEDPNLLAMLGSGAQVVTIVGKSSIFQASSVIGATPEQNLEMVYDSVSFLASRGAAVYFDCEHFFTGFAEDSNYAMSVASAAIAAGASCIVLCDTNGEAMPWQVADIASQMCASHPGKVGVHFHNDKELAVANTIEAVRAGAFHFQGTFNGFGERCGNTRLSTVMALLAASGQIEGVDLSLLTGTARLIAEVSDMPVDPSSPYVGKNAFSHKGGLHIDAVLKNPATYEHNDPAVFGNERHLLVSEVSGRAAIHSLVEKLSGEAGKDSEKTQAAIALIKAKEADGYQYESAQASLELLVMQSLGIFNPPYKVDLYRVIGEKNLGSPSNIASAIVKATVGEKTKISAAEGNGPVNALDLALRKTLISFFPSLSSLVLTDYKVRVIDSASATAAKVRVVMSYSNQYGSFGTVGVSTDVIDASFKALLDSFAFHLLQEELP
ncbi:MAG: citramalate synthase [Eubacteriaceae bacterium]|nr:citramalate synthase [Eubacteriaceae bacterium]